MSNEGSSLRPKGCTCTGDAFADLPANLRPSPRKKTDLRRVTCPGCELVYWTNRATDTCMECEKKGNSIPSGTER